MPLDRFWILFPNVPRVVLPIEADRGITSLLSVICFGVPRGRNVHVALVVETGDARDQVCVKTHETPEVEVTAARPAYELDIPKRTRLRDLLLEALLEAEGKGAITLQQ
jgi:hypothetical protein